MASKPETQFISSVHRNLPNTHCEKNHNTFRSGTADVFYSGNRGDLWVEYKYIPKKVGSLKDLGFEPNVSDLQRVWLGSRFEEGRNIVVIIGFQDGGVVLENRDWEKVVPKKKALANFKSRSEIAQWIYNIVGDKICPKSQIQFLRPPE